MRERPGGVVGAGAETGAVDRHALVVVDVLLRLLAHRAHQVVQFLCQLDEGRHHSLSQGGRV